MPSHYLNQCWNIVNSNLKNKLQWNLKWNLYIPIQANVFEYVICEMAVILSWPQCVNSLRPDDEYLCFWALGRCWSIYCNSLQVCHQTDIPVSNLGKTQSSGIWFEIWISSFKETDLKKCFEKFCEGTKCTNRSQKWNCHISHIRFSNKFHSDRKSCLSVVVNVWCPKWQ